MSFKSFSQIDTPVVILTEDQAKEVAKDLIRYDSLKELYSKLEERVDILVNKESVLKQKLVIKDSIIATQEEYINIQDNIINAKKPITFNGILGVQTNQASVIDPILYFQTEMQVNKFTFGARVFIQPNNPSGYGFIVEYKIF